MHPDNVFISFEFAIAYYFIRSEIFTHRIVADVVSLNGIPPAELTFYALRTCNKKDCTDGTNMQYNVRTFKRQLKIYRAGSSARDKRKHTRAQAQRSKILG